FQAFFSPFISNVAGVKRAGRFEQEHLCFFLRHGSMVDASRNNQELAFFEPDLAIAKLHAESALDHEKQLVLVVMMMPNKRTFEFHQLDQLTVELAGDFRAPMLGE